MDTRTSRAPTRTATAVRAYAARCREVLPEGFGVRSYAGLWLLLATLSPVTSGGERLELEDALGLPVEEAAATAGRLLAEQRDDLDVAVAGWLRPDVALTGTSPVALDALPDQAGLDAWAQSSTRGRVPTFPTTVTPDTVLLLASALVAETRWLEPLEIDGDRLLLDERGLLAVVDTEAAGLVAVAVPPGRGDLDVVSVIAAPELPTAWVWAAVDEVTGWLLDGSLLERRVPAATLTDGHAWRVVRVRQHVSDGPTEVWGASLPAWTLDSTTNLTTAPGVGAVADAVLARISVRPLGVSCVQSATATYTSEGFDAAAVTVMAFTMGLAEDPRPVRKVRRVSLRFDRPHAAVALARGGAWEGVPLVHAWVDGTSDPSLGQSDEIRW
jgi:hypothetical protein